MDSGMGWRTIQVGVVYVAEAEFSDTDQGRQLAKEFKELLLVYYPKKDIYVSVPKGVKKL